VRGVIEFPPLGHLRRWISAAPPSVEWLSELLTHVEVVTENMRQNQRLVGLRPYPTSGAVRRIQCDIATIRNICEALYEMKYPSHLIGWVDKARTLADYLYEAVETFIGETSELNYLLPDSPDWKKSVAQARVHVQTALQHTEALHRHINNLIDDTDDLPRSQVVVKPFADY
jgi:hypothetical protein